MIILSSPLLLLLLQTVSLHYGAIVVMPLQCVIKDNMSAVQRQEGWRVTTEFCVKSDAQHAHQAVYFKLKQGRGTFLFALLLCLCSLLLHNRATILPRLWAKFLKDKIISAKGKKFISVRSFLLGSFPLPTLTTSGLMMLSTTDYFKWCRVA